MLSASSSASKSKLVALHITNMHVYTYTYNVTVYIYTCLQELEGQWQSANSRQEQLEAVEWDLKTQLGEVHVHVCVALPCLFV